MPCFSATVGQVISRGFSNLSYSFISCAANTSTLCRLDDQKTIPSKGEFYTSEPFTPACASSEHLSHLLSWIKQTTSRTGHRSPSSDEKKDAQSFVSTPTCGPQTQGQIYLLYSLFTDPCSRAVSTVANFGFKLRSSVGASSFLLEKNSRIVDGMTIFFTAFQIHFFPSFPVIRRYRKP